MALDTYSVTIRTPSRVSKFADLDGIVTTSEIDARKFAARYAHDPVWTRDVQPDGSIRHSFSAGPVEV